MFYDHNKTIVANFISHLTGDETVQKLLAYSLGRVLLKQVKSTRGTLDLDVTPEDEHIRDWLLAAVRNGEEWLENVDALGRPRKLMKFGSKAQIVQEADKAMRIFAQKNREVQLAEGDEELVHEFDDGWYVVRLTSPRSLDRESGEMQHCIGQGGYDAKVVDRLNYAYYSLRSPFGKAHATMEVSVPEGMPMQLQGKQNEEPIPEYFDRMLEFMKVAGIVPVQLHVMSKWVFDTDHKRHDIGNLPEDVILIGNLDLMFKEISLPKRMTVLGDLRIRDSVVDRMPEELFVGGEFRVRDSTLRTAPAVLTVRGVVGIVGSNCDKIAEKISLRGRLAITRSSVSSLPLGLVAKNELHLTECKHIIDLDGLTSLDYLSLTRMPSNIRLPDGLEVGSLGIFETELSSYPSNILVKGDVDLMSAGLTELPDGLIVHGSLDVSKNPLAALPEGLRVGSHLCFSGTQVDKLPNDFAFGGSLIAHDTPLASLGTLREVNGGLSIARTMVDHIPDDLKVTLDLDASESRLKSIGRGVYVGRALHITKTDVTELPDDIVVRGGLEASYSSLRELPDGFETEGDLRLEGSDLRSLPEGFRASGNVNITYTPISEFPAGVIIEGDLKCSGTRLRRLADDTVVKGDVEHPLGNNLFPRPLERMMMNVARNVRKQAAP